MTIKVTRGVPGSGKSTWAKAWVAEDPQTRARVNRDDIRAMVGVEGGFGSEAQERMVSAIEEANVKIMLAKGIDVVVDATHLRARFAKRWFQFDDDVEFVDFPVSMATAITRDSLRRTGGGRGVGPSVIESFYEKFHINRETGALPKQPVRDSKAAQFKTYVPNESLPPAIIVDIDGTLAHATGRSPYDATRYSEDEVDPVIRDMVNHYSKLGFTILVTSGRDAAFRDSTYNWLVDNDITFDTLIMRVEGDLRNDSVVKDELFEEYIAPRYRVFFALDDRNRVVDMWRAKGIKTLQVQPGDF